MFRDVRTRVAHARHVRRQLPAGPAAGASAACGSCSSSIAAGISTTRCRSRLPGSASDTDQPGAALIQDLKQRGLLRRHAGRLGRRVRPHRLLPGQADRRRLRPRPSSALLHRLAGRRRHQAGHHLRRDRRLLLQHREGSGPRPRPARHDPALPGHRPHAADVQVSGAALPADRRARCREEGDPDVGLRA